MKAQPIISVLMSVYNCEDYISQSIESILKQTFNNFEFIIINDGSTDDSLAIIKKYANKDKRILIINRDNKGLVYSLNEGIKKARGEYIARMDADDISLPQRFEKQLAWLDQTGADICGTRALYFNRLFCKKNNVHIDDAAIKTELLFGSAFAHPTIMGKMTVFKNNLYNEAYSSAQDYFMWVNLALKEIKMTNCPEVLLKYRVHNKQISQHKKKEQQQNHNKIVLYYWRALGMELNNNNNISNANDYKQMVNLLSNRGMINSISIQRLWVRAVKSCNLGLRLWREFINIEQVNVWSFKSISLCLFCFLKKPQFPLKFKEFLTLVVNLKNKIFGI